MYYNILRITDESLPEIAVCLLVFDFFYEKSRVLQNNRMLNKMFVTFFILFFFVFFYIYFCVNGYFFQMPAKTKANAINL